MSKNKEVLAARKLSYKSSFMGFRDDVSLSVSLAVGLVCSGLQARDFDSRL